ncbi:MAG: diguanylate cyclase [Gammaproteobacteria bacterium]|nr:diguanylate cyclase [Gammaproteobacteria bacterium]
MKRWQQRLAAYLSDRNKFFWLVAGSLSIALVGVLDYLTGYQTSFSLFYLAPIFAVTWFGGRGLGIVACIASVLTWLVADYTGGYLWPHPLIHLWNTSVSLGLFLIASLLLAALHVALQHEYELSRTDSLTGAVNRRCFLELAENEMQRLARHGHPFTIAFIDLDDFKAVNDRWGHQAGDTVLCMVVSCVQQHLRKVDTVGRMGGDEFVVLLPETGADAGEKAIAKIHRQLADKMQRERWPVTFSIGVITCSKTPLSIDELINQADRSMYLAKQQGKNQIRYTITAD